MGSITVGTGGRVPHSSGDPGFGQGRGQPAKEGPQALAGPSSCDGPLEI